MVLHRKNDPYGFHELNTLFKAHDHEVMKYSNKSNKPKNELEFLLASGFNTYKAFFSSQDNPSCVFYPSCSSYSVQAFQQKGLIIGTFQTFDRLARCHRFVKPMNIISTLIKKDTMIRLSKFSLLFVLIIFFWHNRQTAQDFFNAENSRKFARYLFTTQQYDSGRQ